MHAFSDVNMRIHLHVQAYELLIVNLQIMNSQSCSLGVKYMVRKTKLHTFWPWKQTQVTEFIK